MAADTIGGALAEGSDVYAADNDPDLVIAAIPFGLKTLESLVAASPENTDLMSAAAAGFAGYAFLLSQEADLRIDADLEQARDLRARASRLYLRGRDFALKALEIRHPGIVAALHATPDRALAPTRTRDAPLLYWAGVGWAGALSADKGNLGLMAELPIAGTIMRRVVALDERYQDGAAQEFLIAFEAGRPGGSLDQARQYFAQALSLSGGRRASVYLACAEGIAVPQQDLDQFRRLLDAALAVDADAVPELRLVNTVAHRRAQWLLARVPDLFIAATVEANETPSE
jgi:predicted anti-sigma-YlaC factor YlaD